jgi:hypothetical protein
VEIDWSTAEVAPNRPGESFALRVEIKGRPDKAFREVWGRETRELARALGDDRRTIDEWMSGSDGIDIRVAPINPEDAAEERRILKELLERVNRAAEPLRAKYQHEEERRRDEQAARERRAEELTKEFRDSE